MNNHSAPSVRLHPPGLVCSLLCFCSLSWLGTRSLPSQQLFFFFWAWHADALSLSGSVCVRLFSFFFFFRQPMLFFCFFLDLFLSPPLPLRVADPDTPIKWTSRLCEGKKSGQKKEEKRMLYHRGNKGRSNLSSSLFGVMTECLPSLWCGIFPSPLFSISLVPIFARLTAALFSLLKAWTRSVEKEKKRSKVMSFWKMRMTV